MKRGNLRAACAASLALAALHFTNPVTAGAQASCAPASRALVTDAEIAASSALSRQISIDANGLTLREALDRLAKSAKLRVSYAADLLPLSRTVCVAQEPAPVGRILSALLAGVAVRPVVVGDQIVLTPQKSGGNDSAPVTGPILKQVGLLDRVVVTGNTSSTIDRSSPSAMDVVSGEQVATRGSTSLSGAIDGAVPGIWVWEQSPVSLLARYGSIRGASSFGVTYPKVYVDGIEVANSLLVTHLDPDAVSRIEIIRGPQGAALYGANAISGVMNIVTRQEGMENGAPRAQIKARGGASASDYSPSSVLAQSHAATLRFGNNAQSARFGVTAAHIGAFIPDAFSQQVTATGGVRRVGAHTVLSSTFRMFAQDSRSPSVPLGLLATGAGSDSSERQSVRQFTVGGSATFTQNATWTHSAIAGVDGYTLKSAALLEGDYPSPIDSALHAATGNAVRATVKANTIGRFGNPEKLASTVTLGMEHSVVRDRTTMQMSPVGPIYGPIPLSMNEVRSNTGFVAQASSSFRDAIFLTTGLRIERNTSPTGLGDIATLPMLGIAAVRELGPATIKLRSAYGKAIRPVQASTWAGAMPGLRGSLLGSSLTPEEQSGTEIGADAFIGRSVAVRVTRFDQRASGLVQPVSISFRANAEGQPDRRYVVYELQNVGDVSNRGWEVQGSVSDGPWSLGATFSQVDSRVSDLATRYTGDLRLGDRMLEVPARTYGVNAGFARGRLLASWNLSRASDWVNYDRLALLRRTEPLVGSELRSYWMNYEGVTRMNGRLGIGLARGMTLTVDGENLLGEQRGEPDNVTVLPGRTVSAGLTIAF